MRLSDHIANVIADFGIRHVFGVVGGGARYLNDSFGFHTKLKFIANHHEQASSFAAEAYARLNGVGCCLVTMGPGGTNALTGCAAAWVDSTPVIFISGNVEFDTLMQGTALRQFGVQEIDILELVRPITKYACRLTKENAQTTLEVAITVATTGRKGPVWIDVPLDVQNVDIELGARWPLFDGVVTFSRRPPFPPNVSEAAALLASARRPVIVAGNGIRLAGARKSFRALIDALRIPVITSWSAADLLPEHPCHIGHMGIFGDRAANFAVQSTDVILVLGSRLSIPHIGNNYAAFAPNAKIVMVDIDPAEMAKPSLKVHFPICSDVGKFIEAFAGDRQPYEDAVTTAVDHREWLERCQGWRERYPVVLTEYAGTNNSYEFVRVLCDALPTDAVVVLDMGTAFTGTYQAARMKDGQRWLTAAGLSPMGYGLPGAIGAHYATGKRVVCITGDGGFQFNCQELATIAHHNLPITIFVLNNDGYGAIKATQERFGRRVGVDPKSGLRCPDAMEVARAYGLMAGRIDVSEVHAQLLGLREVDRLPILFEIMLDPDQPLMPRMKSRDGAPSPLHDMYPFLEREEIAEVMR